MTALSGERPKTLGHGKNYQVIKLGVIWKGFNRWVSCGSKSDNQGYGFYTLDRHTYTAVKNFISVSDWNPIA